MTAPLRGYQQRAVDRWLIQPQLGLALEPGLGKTRAIQRGMRFLFEVDRWLVVAPKLVSRDVWRQEAAKWGEVNPTSMVLLTAQDFGMCRPSASPELNVWLAANPDKPIPEELRPPGAPKDWDPGELLFRSLKETRRRIRALIDAHRVTLCSWEWVWWLAVVLGEQQVFDGVVLDELGFARTKGTKRWQATRRLVRHARFIVGANGTPMVNGWENIFAQSYLLDRGATYGATLGEFRTRYLQPARFGPGGRVLDWGAPSLVQEKELHSKFRELWLPMQKKDYLDLPPMVINDVVVPMPDEAWKLASEYLNKAIAELKGQKVLVENAGVGFGKALQVCQGAVYDDTRAVVHLHDEKLDRLEELVEGAEGGVMVLYQYLHDRERILARLGKTAVDIKAKDSIERWRAGKHKVLLSHPKSVGFGLNFQDVGNTTIWFGLTTDMELYAQANERMNRPGQEADCVIIHRLLTAHAAERVASDNLAGKGSLLELLMKEGPA